MSNESSTFTQYVPYICLSPDWRDVIKLHNKIYELLAQFLHSQRIQLTNRENLICLYNNTTYHNNTLHSVDVMLVV